MNDVLLLKPHLVYKMWGSNHLKEQNIDLNDAIDVGEAWAISGFKDKSSVITNGEYRNQKLYDIFRNHKELFDNYKGDEYPLVNKYIDCNENLAIEVHPLDKYAQDNYKEAGGREKCWYVLKAKPNADVIVGHTAKTATELNNLIKEEKWDQLAIRRKVQAGDVVYVPAGCIHALNEGLILYEVQFSSKPVFRLYNYNRDLFDEAYKLNVDEAVVNTIIPYKEPKYKHNSELLAETKKFKFLKVVNKSTKTYKYDDARWVQVTVISGNGRLNDKYELKTGVSFVVPSTMKSFKVEGNVTMLVSYLIKK